MSERRYDLLTETEIDDGTATAAYFLRTEEILDDHGKNPEVVAELSAPSGWHLVAGLKDAASLLADRPVDVYAPAEGTAITGGPILRIEGPYRSFARYESPLLGLIAHASGIASAAWRICAAAGDRQVLSFGTRRQHPALGAMIERSALIGGVDGIGNAAGGDCIGVKAGGTMPHALAIVFGSAEAAWRAFDETLPPDIPRVMLCDTFGDEAAEATSALATLGDALDGVRLDTTASRRGNMRQIVDDVRWALDRHEGEDVDILVSGGIDVTAVRHLRDVVDGFGVGSAIANADPLDLSLNIVSVDGEPRSKRGVKAGAKTVYRDGMTDRVVPADAEAPGEDLLQPFIQDGDLVRDIDRAAAEQRAAAAVESLSPEEILDGHIQDEPAGRGPT